MLRRRALLENLGGGDVPEWRLHLQPCEYIETDGNSWINLPFNCNYITNINNLECKGNTIFGLRKQGGRFFQLSNSDGKYFFRYFCTGSEIMQSTINITDWLKFSFIDNVANFSNEIIVNTNSVEKNINLNIILFRTYINNVYNNALLGTQINKFETNLFNLLSVYVIDEYSDNKGNTCSSGVAGMVDVETGVFYTNDGTGVFSHGADIEI